MSSRVPRENKLIALDRRCLIAILDAELGGAAVDAHTWRAKNPKYIPRIQELTRRQLLTTKDNTRYVVTLYGLMRLGGERADAQLSLCSRLFGSLKRHYSKHATEPVSVVDLAKRMKCPPSTVLQSAEFLSRSTAYLSIHTVENDFRLLSNENFVTLTNFKALEYQVREQARLAVSARRSTVSAAYAVDNRLFAGLHASESEVVRNCWDRSIERLPTDSAGAITAARSLLEAAAKYVLEEFGHSPDRKADLPRLYKDAAKCLKLDPAAEVHESLRQILQGGAMIVDGLAHFRNTRGDAHGPGRHAPKPARRHAEFAVLIAGAMTSYLLASLDAQRTL
jgi:Abortive infection C-terminus